MNVSVVIPVYNAARFLERAVSSAIDQPETGEVILIEDCSPDDSLAVSVRLANDYSRVRLLRHPDAKNHGAGASRNLGIQNARHEFIGFLDADDFYLPGRFSRAMEILSSEPDIDGVYEAIGCHLDNDAARKRWAALRLPMLMTMTDTILPDRLFEALAGGGHGFMHTDSMTVRRSLFDRSGLFNEKLRIGQDVDMWVRMAAVGRLKGGRLDEPVACARAHDQNRIFGVPCSKDMVDRRNLFFDEIQAWAEQNGLSKSRRSLLTFMRLSANYCVSGYQSPVTAISAMTRGLVRDAIRFPSIVFSPYLPYHIVRKLLSKATPRFR